MQLPAGQVCAQMCRVRACQKLVPPPFDKSNSFPISMPPQILILSGLLTYLENSKPNIFLSSKSMSFYSRVKSKWINLKQVIFVWNKIIIVVHAKCHFAFHTLDLCARAKRITICMIVDCRRCNKKRSDKKIEWKKIACATLLYSAAVWERSDQRQLLPVPKKFFHRHWKFTGTIKRDCDAFHPNWSAAGLGSAQTWQCIYSAMHEVKPLWRSILHISCAIYRF